MRDRPTRRSNIGTGAPGPARLTTFLLTTFLLATFLLATSVLGLAPLSASAQAPTGTGTETASTAPIPEPKPFTPRQASVAGDSGQVPLECIEQAARAFNVSGVALAIILEREGGIVGKCSRPNKNGTVDCGPAQINDVEITDVAKALHWPREKAFRLVRDDACFNVLVQAYVLAKKLRAAKGDIWDAMGRYNSATPEYKERYQNGLINAYNAIKAR